MPESASRNHERRAAGRWSGLDGLRGLAALVVTLRHTLTATAIPMPTLRALVDGPLAPLLSAQGAVQLFFVLSGLVLSASLSRRAERAHYLPFVVKRYLRIHPAYLAGVAFAWLASHFYGAASTLSGSSPHLHKVASVDPSAGEILAALIFPTTAGGLLPVGWTLTVEMIYSLLLPAMILVAARTHWSVLLLLSLYCVFELQGVPRYSFDFALGIAIFQSRQKLEDFFARAPALVGILAVASSVALVGAPSWLGWSVRVETLWLAGFQSRDIAVMGLGAAGLVTCALCVPWFAGVLSRRPMRFLGRVSYSLYLVHYTVIVLLAPVMGTQFGWNRLLMYQVLVLAVALTLSHFAERWIERPSIRAGAAGSRALEARMRARP